MIELHKITKYLGDSCVLKNISFRVSEGESAAVLGLSGSGKTTLLKLIAGVYAPDSGEIFVNGIPVIAENLFEVRARLGYVIQGGGLFPHLTAYQNVRLVGFEAGWDEAHISTRIADLAALTQLNPSLYSHFPSQLSAGQRQRFGIMRALLRDPPILLLDEPLGALDPITRSELQDELKSLFDKLGKTVLLVTHDIFEAAYLTKSLLLINRGHLLQQGTISEITHQPADDFVRTFVQSQRTKVRIP